TLANVRGDLSVYGDALSAIPSAGTDVLNVRDDAGDPGQVYTLDAGSVERSGAGRIEYDRLEAVTLTTTGYHDTINVAGSPAATPLTVSAGEGNDHIVVGTTSAAGLEGPVTVYGGDDSDTLDYSAFVATASVRVNLLTGTATGLSAISGIENV